MRYFGEAWDAPLLDGAVQIRTPIGTRCEWCGLPIIAGDCGFMIPLVYSYGGRNAIAPSYIHRECHFAEDFGHLVGVCGCTGYHRDRGTAVIAWGRFQLVREDPPW